MGSGKKVVRISRKGANEKQKIFFRNQTRHKFNAYIGGIGAGKSFALAWCAFRYVLHNPGLPGLIVGNSHNQVKTILLPPFIDFLKAAGLFKSWNKNDREIKTKTGALIKYGTAEKASSYESFNAVWGVGDEIRYWKQHSFTVFFGRIRLEGPLMGACIASTPVNHWMRDELEKVDELTGESLWTLTRASTLVNMANLRAGYYDDLRSSYSKAVLAQYANGEWISMEGAVYSEFQTLAPRSEDRNVDDLIYQSSTPITTLVDFGFNSPSVLLTQHFDACPQHHVAGCLHILDEIHEDRILNKKLAMLARRRIEHHGWMRPNDRTLPGFCDPSGNNKGKDGRRWVDEWYDEGFNLQWCNVPELKDVSNSVDLVRTKVCDSWGRRSLYVDSSLLRGHKRGVVRCFENYRYKDTSDGKNRAADIDVPEKDNVHDHAMDALRYGVVNWHGGYGKLRAY